MQTIQIQEFNNISDQKIYLENIEYLKQHFNEILEISEQTLAENLIKETEILLKQTQDNSKTYREKYEIFIQLDALWLNQWQHYKGRPEAIDFIKSISDLTNFFIAHYKMFLELSLINEGRTGNEREDLERIASGFLFVSERENQQTKKYYKVLYSTNLRASHRVLQIIYSGSSCTDVVRIVKGFPTIPTLTYILSFAKIWGAAHLYCTCVLDTTLHKN
jgi:hypothetical protein